jgi:SOS-response transcriptional repressor LexA
MQIRSLNQWVASAVKIAGGQAELARRITKELRRNVDRAAVNKMIAGDRSVAADELLAIEATTGLSIPSPNVPAKVPLIDWVRAGRFTESKSQIPIEDVPLLAFADLGRGDFFALKVEGGSMDRVSPEGSIIVVDKSDRVLVSGKCYVFSVRGETTYKRWHAGPPPYLDPNSSDQIYKPIFVKRKRDLEVIGRVRRTVLDL